MIPLFLFIAPSILPSTIPLLHPSSPTFHPSQLPITPFHPPAFSTQSLPSPSFPPIQLSPHFTHSTSPHLFTRPTTTPTAAPILWRFLQAPFLVTPSWRHQFWWGRMDRLVGSRGGGVWGLIGGFEKCLGVMGGLWCYGWFVVLWVVWRVTGCFGG